MAEEAIGRRSPAALSVLVDLASEVSSSKKRLGNVITSPMDGFWRPDFAGAPHGEQCHCLSLKSGRSASAPALARQPFCATDGPQTTLSSISRSVAVSHRQWLAVTAPKNFPAWKPAGSCWRGSAPLPSSAEQRKEGFHPKHSSLSPGQRALWTCTLSAHAHSPSKPDLIHLRHGHYVRLTP